MNTKTTEELITERDSLPNDSKMRLAINLILKMAEFGGIFYQLQKEAEEVRKEAEGLRKEVEELRKELASAK